MCVYVTLCVYLRMCVEIIFLSTAGMLLITEWVTDIDYVVAIGMSLHVCYDVSFLHMYIPIIKIIHTLHETVFFSTKLWKLTIFYDCFLSSISCV